MCRWAPQGPGTCCPDRGHLLVLPKVAAHTLALTKPALLITSSNCPPGCPPSSAPPWQLQLLHTTTPPQSQALLPEKSPPVSRILQQGCQGAAPRDSARCPRVTRSGRAQGSTSTYSLAQHGDHAPPCFPDLLCAHSAVESSQPTGKIVPLPPRVASAARALQQGEGFRPCVRSFFGEGTGCRPRRTAGLEPGCPRLASCV